MMAYIRKAVLHFLDFFHLTFSLLFHLLKVMFMRWCLSVKFVEQIKSVHLLWFKQLFTKSVCFNLKETAANLEEAIQEREELSESCADLKQQMAQVHVEEWMFNTCTILVFHSHQWQSLQADIDWFFLTFQMVAEFDEDKRISIEK